MQPSKQRANVEPGAIIAGKYEIEKEIGKGGMGLILAARHLQLEERVALKFLMAPEERVEEFQERFLREARITAKLRGAHVARTLDYGVTDEGDPYIVMEYLEGVNLRQLMRESGPLPLEVAVNYTLQACEGLAEAHRNEVVHRDLKPANLFLTKHLDGGDLLKILDFGVSKLRNFAAAQSDLTEAGTLLGSPKYMAIEQLTMAGDVDERADVWSLGTILYEMLAGRPPFDGPNTSAVCMAIMRGSDPTPLSELRPELPCELDGVVARCLSRDLFTRTTSVAVLARELVEASGIRGLEPAVQAVADVLSQQPLSSTSTGQMRAFGQTGQHLAARNGGDSTSRSNDAPEEPLAEEAVPGAGTNGRPRTLVFAAAGLVALGGLAAYFFTRAEPGTLMAPPTVSVPTAVLATSAAPDVGVVDSSDASSVAVDAGLDAEKDGDTSDARSDATPDAKRTVSAWRPPRTPPPPATKPPPPATATATRKKPQDTFGSRY